MGFYSFKVPRTQTWVAWTVGAGTVLVSFVAYDTARSRRGAVPVFNSSRVVRTEEQARYPCAALKGLDVVVRNYYVEEDAAVRRRREKRDADVLYLTEEQRAAAVRQQQSRSFFSLDGIRCFVSLFSNEANHPSRGLSLAGRQVFSDKDDLSAVRLVGGNASAADSGQGEATVDPSSLRFADSGAAGNREGVAAQSQKEEEQAPLVAGAPNRAFVASSTWPPHTEKYAALILEPSRSRTGEAGDLSEHLQDPLRWLADAATHQSLVRCRSRSALVEMNCDADPTYLGAAYLRVMLSAFLLLPSMAPGSGSGSQPLRVAVLGVAGGSLPNFLQRYFSSTLKGMDLVDVEPECFRAASEQLGMGKLLDAAVAAAGERGSAGSSVDVRVYASDAAAFLRENQRQMAGVTSGTESRPVPPALIASAAGTTPVFPSPAAPPRQLRGRLNRPYDMLFVDTFVGSELAPDVGTPDFLLLCKRSLTSFGVAAFNLPEPSTPFLRSCELVFGKANVYTIPTPGTSNVVVLARGGLEESMAAGGLVGPSAAGSTTTTTLPHLSHRLLYRRAQQLQETYQLPYDLANHYPVWWRFW